MLIRLVLVRWTLIVDIVLNLIKECFIFVGVISNNNEFPQPLSESEEKEIFEKFSQGDEIAKNELITRNLRLVAHISKKFSLQASVDDLISIGTVGLIKAVDTFDYKKGSRFATYASRCIENEILMNIRSSRKMKSEVYLEDPIGVDKEGNEICLIDILGTDLNYVHDDVERRMLLNKIYELIESILDEREKAVIVYRYGINTAVKTQREIANLLGTSRSYISRIETKALMKIRKAMSITIVD